MEEHIENIKVAKFEALLSFLKIQTVIESHSLMTRA